MGNRDNDWLVYGIGFIINVATFVALVFEGLVYL